MMFEVLEKGLQAKGVGRADLVQLRGQKRVMTTCRVKNGMVDEFSNVVLSGISARVLVEGRTWGFSSTNRVEGEAVKKAVKTALKLAQGAAKLKESQAKLEPLEGVKADESVPAKKPLSNYSTKDIVEIPLAANAGANEGGSEVANIEATYLSIEDDKYFTSSEGSQIHQMVPRVQLFVNVIAKRNGHICPASESLGHTGGFELFDGFSSYSLGKTVADKAVKLLDAKLPPSGKFQVVIHPTLCATLLHEAIGHPLEADLAMVGGGFGGRIGEQVSSELVTIYDDGHIPGGLGYFAFDDEGVKCRRSVLIENGVLKSFMHDRTSAAMAETTSTGNAHAWDYSVEPLIRQTNIGIEGGDNNLEEMIEGIQKGLFLEGTFGGQSDANSNFTFGFQNAKWIRRGELAEELRGTNVAGNAIDVFNTIDAVSKEVVLRPGACGKTQWAIQGRIVPAIRCEIMVGGMGARQ